MTTQRKHREILESTPTLASTKIDIHDQSASLQNYRNMRRNNNDYCNDNADDDDDNYSPSKKSKQKFTASKIRNNKISCFRMLIILLAVSVSVKLWYFVNESTMDRFHLISDRNVNNLISLSSAASTFKSSYHDDDKHYKPLYPSTLKIISTRKSFTSVPKDYRKLFHVSGRKGTITVMREFHSLGWRYTRNPKEAHFIWEAEKKPFYNSTVLQPWQRYTVFPNITIWDAKDNMYRVFQLFKMAQQKRKNPIDQKLPFLPETYRLYNNQEAAAFLDVLNNEGGKNRPWVMKMTNVNNGLGVEILPPNSAALETAVERSKMNKAQRYIVQAYICNELPWFHGEKFDLRFFWMAASYDPLLLFFHDGSSRISGGKYSETQFSNNTKDHLTHLFYRQGDQTDTKVDYLWKRIREHYNNNKQKFSQYQYIQDPVEHVRNQMKHIVATFGAAFAKRAFTINNTKVVPQNYYGVFGIDFIIDNDLDVWLVEAQQTPGFVSPYDHHVDMFHKIYRGLILAATEVAEKQQINPQANLLPFKNDLGEWEMVFAGNSGNGQSWRYLYKEHYLVANRKRKKSCLPPTKKLAN